MAEIEEEAKELDSSMLNSESEDNNHSHDNQESQDEHDLG